MQNKRTTHEYQVQYDNHKIILRPIQRRRKSDLLQSLLYSITLAFALSICFSGVGALGSWGMEIIAANANPTTSSSYHWQARKNICMGLMLVGLSGFLAGFLGAALVSEIAGEIDE
ncbi:hypothetical protein [Nostoc sp. MS1]|uniref:hypothetical protein n=1 Tax=Nostoc sp. MS1 TaxID=2764711 RepID=UPI001CC3F877|nr:hypothetical protein [Nostoc sp. MS1]